MVGWHHLTQPPLLSDFYDTYKFDTSFVASCFSIHHTFHPPMSYLDHIDSHVFKTGRDKIRERVNIGVYTALSRVSGHCSATGHDSGHDEFIGRCQNASACPLHGACRATLAQLSFCSDKFADVWMLCFLNSKSFSPVSNSYLHWRNTVSKGKRQSHGKIFLIIVSILLFPTRSYPFPYL